MGENEKRETDRDTLSEVLKTNGGKKCLVCGK